MEDRAVWHAILGHCIALEIRVEKLSTVCKIFNECLHSTQMLERVREILVAQPLPNPFPAWLAPGCVDIVWSRDYVYLLTDTYREFHECDSQKKQDLQGMGCFRAHVILGRRMYIGYSKRFCYGKSFVCYYLIPGFDVLDWLDGNFMGEWPPGIKTNTINFPLRAQIISQSKHPEKIVAFVRNTFHPSVLDDAHFWQLCNEFLRLEKDACYSSAWEKLSAVACLWAEQTLGKCSPDVALERFCHYFRFEALESAPLVYIECFERHSPGILTCKNLLETFSSVTSHQNSVRERIRHLASLVSDKHGRKFYAFCAIYVNERAFFEPLARELPVEKIDNAFVGTLASICAETNQPEPLLALYREPRAPARLFSGRYSAMAIAVRERHAHALETLARLDGWQHHWEYATKNNNNHLKRSKT